METLTDRITRYLLARLRRRAVLELYKAAANVGLLEGYPAGEDEESGTVWTVADNTRQLLTGDKYTDLKLITRRLGTSMTCSSGTTLDMFDYETDQDAELELRPRTKSRVKHIAGSAGKDKDQAARLAIPMPGQPSMAKDTDILALLRQHVPAPSVAHVAVALLVARAVGSSILDIETLRELVARADIFVLIKAPVARFERRFAKMLKDGLLLPYRVKVGDVYHGASLREQYHGEPRTKPRRAVKLLSGNRAHRIEHTALSQHLADALLDRSTPVIIVDETSVAPSPSLALTVDVFFECQGLDHALLAELLHITLGIAPTRSLKGMEVLALDLEGLSIDDLTLAIRPSHNLETILATLAALADKARNGDEDDDSRESDGRHGGTGKDTTSKSRKAKSGETGKTSSSPEGVDIIQPLKPAAEKTGAETGVDGMTLSEPLADSHAQQPRIETLSGYGEATQWALDLKADLQVWRARGLGWSEMNTKLLLSGPPGTGKTTYARALCNTLQVPLLITSVAAWLEPGYLGDVLKRMSQAFEVARAHAPSILFIDEIDNIGSRSGGRREQHDDYWRSLINRLLELLDGASKTDGVIVVGATNLADRIDPALLRSGRLEKHVVIPMPDTDAIAGIFAHHLGADLPSVLSSAPNTPVLKRMGPPKATDHDPQQMRKTAERRKLGKETEAPQ
ncbi:ATPase family protein associated with various cellular activities (AAA) [Rhizobium sp. PP-CC-3A-592]|nr:ATPase family protein associated with various cellular activities (AAA) [Rhizobium sp. PP-CC-3A-592]